MKLMRNLAMAGMIALAGVGLADEAAPSGFITDFEAAKAEAAKDGKVIFVYFGSADEANFMCRYYETEYFAKPEFIEEAKRGVVLFYTEVPLKDAEGSEKNALLGKYGVTCAPTMKLLTADGEVLADIEYLDFNKSAKEHAESLCRAALPEWQKQIAPYRREVGEMLSAYMRDYASMMQEAVPDGENEDKVKYERMQKLSADYLPKLVSLREKASAVQIGEELKGDLERIVDQLDEAISGFKECIDTSWEEWNKKREESEKEWEERQEEMEKEREAKEEAWLKDWSENIRTNMTLETCGKFRERVLRPFLLGEMDPEGKATDEERAVLNGAITAIWECYNGVFGFDRREELLTILDRLAKKPFASMIRAIVRHDESEKATAEWIVDGKFAGEDMRAVYWTLRSHALTNSSRLSELLDEADVDPWIKATWRIGPANDKAWKARGGGYANTVTDEGWEGYEKHGNASRAACDEALELQPFPEPIYLLSCLGPFDDDLFEKATAAQIDMPVFYEHFVWYNCFPRWCGSHAKMKRFAERCYDTKRHDSMIPLYYADTILRMIFDGGGPGDGVEGYFREYPEELDKILEVSLPQMNSEGAFKNTRQIAATYATLAYSLKGEWEKAVETFRSYTHELMASVLWFRIQNFSHWWKIWDGISGPNSTEFIAAHRLFTAKDYAAFLGKIAEIRATYPLSDKETVYANEMELSAKAKTVFLNGETMVATFPTDKTSWLTYNGAWQMNGEYAFLDGSECNLATSMYWDIAFPESFRVECDVGPHDPAADWNFLFYHESDDRRVSQSGIAPYFRMSVAAGDCTAGFGTWDQVKAYEGETRTSFSVRDSRVHLAIVYKDGKVSVYIDGAEQPAIETSDHAEIIKAAKDGRFHFDGANVRLLSLKVMRP